MRPFLAGWLLIATTCRGQLNASIPSYVLEYAPLVYLDVNEEYYPSDIAAQIVHTTPQLNFTTITNGPSNLTLSTLSGLNGAAGCIGFEGCNVYLNSRDTITVKPTEQWLLGVLPDPITGETKDATSCAVIVTDHGNGTIDAFYMFFYAFNYGIPTGSPNGTIYGDHVGDWEHMMVRFVNQRPVNVYYSVHNGGQAYTYDAVLKNGSRPLGFSSKGGHATYAQEGLHVMYGGIANDSTSRGPLWDPVAGSGAWYYTFTPNNTAGSSGVFTAVDVTNRTARGVGPTDWLYYYGRWGDKQYNSSYPGQNSIAGIAVVFADGPTGPLDKDLYRTGACPDVANGCSTRSALEASSGTAIPQTVTRNYASATGATNTASSGVSSTRSAGAAATGIRHPDLGGNMVHFAALAGLAAVVL